MSHAPGCQSQGAWLEAFFGVSSDNATYRGVLFVGSGDLWQSLHLLPGYVQLLHIYTHQMYARHQLEVCVLLML